MSSHEEEFPLPRWIEDDDEVDETLRDVVVPHETNDDPQDGDGDGDGDGSRKQGRAA